jgi:hypothetical protein
LVAACATLIVACSLGLPADSEYVGGDGGSSGIGGADASVGGNAGTSGDAGIGGTGGAGSGGTQKGSGGTAGSTSTGGTAGSTSTGGTAGSTSTGGTAGAGAIPTLGLELWLNGDNVVAGPVATWSDQSGKGKHATQSATNAQPTSGTRTLNGHAVVDFDGIDDFYSLPSGFKDFTAGVTVVIVLQSDTIVINEGHLFLGNTGNGDLIRFSRDYHHESAVFNVGMDPNWVYSADGTYKTAMPTMLTGIQAPASGGVATTRLLIDTAQQMSSDLAPVTNNLRILNWVGRSNLSGTFFDGYMAEILVYSRALSDADLSLVHGNLQGKYVCCGN